MISSSNVQGTCGPSFGHIRKLRTNAGSQAKRKFRYFLISSSSDCRLASLENFVVQRPAKKRKVEEELLDVSST